MRSGEREQVTWGDGQSVCMYRGVIKRQRRRDEEKGGEKEREGEREGYSNIVGKRER